MRHRPHPLRRAVTWTQLWPSLRAGLAVVVLFVTAIALTRRYAAPMHEALSDHALLGMMVFFVSSVVAVLLPMLTNLPLIPVAAQQWGPWSTASLLLTGWVAGAALSFWLGRDARHLILRHFPSVQRHAQIDRLIHPQHRMWSLVLLRMTFPVDVLSYALGLFSRSTTLFENMVSTALGAAPFALLFSWFPTLSDSAQWTLFGVSLLGFVLYLAWILHQPGRDGEPS